MKYKMLALILALSVLSWAQTATPAAPSTPQQNAAPADKSNCPCCKKMAATDAKAGATCCARHSMEGKDKDGKEMASGAMACMKSGKDASASCCKDACSKETCAKDKTAAACCGNSCEKSGMKGCCSGDKGKTAKSCCKNKKTMQS